MSDEHRGNERQALVARLQQAAHDCVRYPGMNAANLSPLLFEAAAALTPGDAAALAAPPAAPPADLVALVREVLACAYQLDNKPHLLFAAVRRLALALPDAFTDATVRMLDEAYSRAERLLPDAPRVPDTPQGCINCGETGQGGYYTDEGRVGSFCRECWEFLCDEFAAPRVPDTPQGWTPEYIAGALAKAYPPKIQEGDVIEFAYGNDPPMFQRVTHPASVEDWNGKLRNRVRGIYRRIAPPQEPPR